MNDDVDARVAERFNVLDAAEPPDLWPRIITDAGLGRRDRTTSIAVIAAVAACVIALVAGLASVVALRSADQVSPPATQLVPSTTTVPQVGLSSCLEQATCAPVEWDAIDIGDRVIDLVYYVDAECTGALIGTRSDENDTAVEISVFVERDPDVECSGDVLQRSTSVLLEESVADLAEPVPQRALTGCRNPDSVIASPTSATTADDTAAPDCRVEFVDQFPVYPSARLLEEYEATKEQVGFEGSASEPINIDTPGTYTLKAYVDDDWDLNACAWGYSGEIDRFASGVFIEQVSDFANGSSFVASTDEGGTYVEWTMTVTDVTYPIDGFFVTIDQCA